MNMWSVLALLFAAAAAHGGTIIFPDQLDHAEGELCSTNTGKEGICAQTCQHLPNLSGQRRCGIKNSKFLVCCEVNLDNITDPLLQSSDISPPAGYNTVTCGKSAIKRIETFGPSPLSLLVDRQRRESVPLSPNFNPKGIGVVEPAVVGGKVSFRAAWPWMALLGERDAVGVNWFCGGALINEYWILSAAHCFKDFKADVVRLGEHDYADDNDGALHKDFDVQQLILYPDYKPPKAYHDLALLKLDTRVNLQKFILPVCLPWGKVSEETIVNTVTTIVGWGNTLYGGFPSSVLMEADVQVFPSSRCDRSYSSIPQYRAKWPHGIGKETLCAGDPEGGKDACQGDSGGPLVSQNSSGRYVLAGIVSRGYGCGHKDYPGLYANIRHHPYLAWIKKIAFGAQ